MDIVYVHGWGCSPAYWTDLAAKLPEHDAHFVDLGFIGQAENLDVPKERAIYITHSFGTMWALKYHADKMGGLVSLGGFGSFKRFGNSEALDNLKNALLAEPFEYMNNFWNAAEIKPASDAAGLNIEKLVAAFDWLKDWDMRYVLDDLGCQIMVLNGDNDVITPLDAMRKEWAGHDLRICSGGGHGLAQTHTEWCAKQIMGALR